MNYGLNQILIAAGSYYFEQPFAVPDFTEKPIVLSTRALKNSRAGMALKHFPLEIKLWVENKQLIAQATGQSAFPLTPFAGNRFKFEGRGWRSSSRRIPLYPETGWRRVPFPQNELSIGQDTSTESLGADKPTRLRIQHGSILRGDVTKFLRRLR
ncbi:MAG: hypothetical protein CM15mP74_02880 [Halieaceae bacterium]|nr:MAG: hypothetical protein CM15mP74_02880 [Halieaceae bacterium]